MSLFISIVFISLGGAMIWWGAHTWRETSNFVKNANTAQGEVIEFKTHESIVKEDGRERSEIIYFPVVKFRDKIGKEVIFTSSSGHTIPSKNVGETVTVFYNPQDPQDARIEPDQFSAKIALVLGIALIIIPFCYYYLAKYENRFNTQSVRTWTKQLNKNGKI